LLVIDEGAGKEALALAFEGGEPQRIARERLGRKP